jgi:recombination protein RecA
MKTSGTKQAPSLSPEGELALIRKKLKHFTLERQVRYWLDTGSSRLNGILGSKEKGLPYGKMYEIAGFESQGKTALMKKLAGIAQKDGAKVAWVGLEDSYDPDWAVNLGLNPEEVYLFEPQIVGTMDDEDDEEKPSKAKEKKRKKLQKAGRLQTAEELLEEVEEWMRQQHMKNPNGRLFVAVDSIAAMLTEEEAAAGIQDQNMRTKVSLASFLSRFLRRWVAMVSMYNAMVLFANQLRINPGQMFGNPEYTVGGNAVRLYSAVRIRMRRKGKKILKGGNEIGIKGTMTNWKNKAGGGSREGGQIGYKLYFDGKIKYVDVDDIKTEGE